MPKRPGTHKPVKRITAVHRPAGTPNKTLEIHQKGVLQWRDGKTTAQRGYGSKWQTARNGYIRSHPLCVHCLAMAPQRFTPTDVVDHIVPHRGDWDLFWDSGNWQSLCFMHHNIKTAEECNIN